MAPDRGSRLSDGVVIETRLRARLFGAPVLKIDGTVLVSPARLVEPTPPRVVQGGISDARWAASRSTGTGDGWLLHSPAPW